VRFIKIIKRMGIIIMIINPLFTLCACIYMDVKKKISFNELKIKRKKI